MVPPWARVEEAHAFTHIYFTSDHFVFYVLTHSTLNLTINIYHVTVTVQGLGNS